MKKFANDISIYGFYRPRRGSPRVYLQKNGVLLHNHSRRLRYGRSLKSFKNSLEDCFELESKYPEP
jgi:hypothetical protein